MVEEVSIQRSRRSPIAAFALSFIVPGLGQIYNTQIRRGLALFAASLLLAPFLFALPIGLYPAGLTGVILALFLFRPLAAIDAAWSARRLGTVALRPFNRSIAYLLIGIAAVALTWARAPLLEAVRRVDLFRIPAESMVPTLLVGDFVAADRAAFVDGGAEPGDLVAFEAPVPEQEMFVQRVVAVEGDTAEVRGGVLFVNGQQSPASLQGARRDPRVRPPGASDPMVVPADAGNADHYGPVVVPSGHMFILGDSRDNSIDSRYYGFVSVGALASKPSFVFLSWDYAESRPRFERFGLDLD